MPPKSADKKKTPKYPFGRQGGTFMPNGSALTAASVTSVRRFATDRINKKLGRNVEAGVYTVFSLMAKKIIERAAKEAKMRGSSTISAEDISRAADNIL